MGNANFWGFTPSEIERRKKEFPKGTKIRIFDLGGFRRFDGGLKAFVKFVDDDGLIHCVADDLESYMLSGEDDYRKVG